MTNAIIVGSGPNGLAAAVTLAEAGIDVTVVEAADTIGGGTRTSELTVPGVLHDHCSAVHPMGVASPFFRSLDLESHGLQWLHPEVAVAHPLESGAAGVLHRSIEDTATGLGRDGAAWARYFGPRAANFDVLAGELFRPILHAPRHPLALARFGLDAATPATWTARRWRTPEARALFGGIAAHALQPLSRPTTSAVALMMIAAGHRYGWPVAKGGSRAVTDALASLLLANGGSIETGRFVRSLSELPAADIVMLDLSPTAVAHIAGDRLPPRVARAYRRWRYGPSAFKVDLAVEGGVPWINEDSRRAGTVHVGGAFGEIAAAERAVAAGVMPERPFVLVGQQYLADPSRSAGDVHPVWAYAHVPHGYPVDATEIVIDRIEQFAPGLRDRIVGRHARSASAMAAYNPNYVGGDILTGSNDPLQVAMRPRIALDPYKTGIPGVYICSAATPPGAGVHGMGGYNAATSALNALTRDDTKDYIS
ncbi:phytoene dehydrogenase-like protein [Rhodococcus sp. PvR044]|uniref:phytoene desaturase family protein n=1 Tax=unclassified Rhodococcus (in: high G+C Gram-positive bacteria) TaxID=192944 RepID=UPI000BC5FE2B|nr:MULTISPECIES: NAD(P)/FAD-dependent oxidoreductase [unclassified Rhodococcus (in: high G+C Gram-positive bacteria)]PTR38967.1 phytoene dehydrogenase-like protein [Rhodococcus sp. OK611]SNX92753.1 Phytoene dehydrogenase-related protein [Rhodococcus sp. OK270]